MNIHAFLTIPQIAEIRGITASGARDWVKMRHFPVYRGTQRGFHYGFDEHELTHGDLHAWRAKLTGKDVEAAKALVRDIKPEEIDFFVPKPKAVDHYVSARKIAEIREVTEGSAARWARRRGYPELRHTDGKSYFGFTIDDMNSGDLSTHWHHMSQDELEHSVALADALNRKPAVSSDYTRQLTLYDVGQSDEGDGKTVAKPAAAVKKIDQPETLNEIDLDPEDRFGDPNIFTDFDDDDFGKVNDDDDFDPRDFGDPLDDDDDDGFWSQDLKELLGDDDPDDDDFDPDDFGEPVKGLDLEFENDVDKPVAFFSVSEYAKGMGIKSLVAAEHNLIMSGCHKMVCDDGVVRYGLTDRMYFSDDFNWHDIDLDEFTECEDWAKEFRARRNAALADEDKDGLFTGFLLYVNMILWLIGSFIRGAFTNPVLEWQQAELERLREENAELKELVAGMTADNDDHAVERKAA